MIETSADLRYAIEILLSKPSASFQYCCFFQTCSLSSSTCLTLRDRWNGQICILYATPAAHGCHQKHPLSKRTTVETEVTSSCVSTVLKDIFVLAFLVLQKARERGSFWITQITTIGRSFMLRGSDVHECAIKHKKNKIETKFLLNWTDFKICFYLLTFGSNTIKCKAFCLLLQLNNYRRTNGFS